MDLAVEYHVAWNIIEVKLLRNGRKLEPLVEEGKKQILKYRESFSPSLRGRGEGKVPACYLVIFDRREAKGSWEDRLFWNRQEDLTVLGC